VPGCNPSVRPAAGHYYGSRDDLIAAMITDAFDELARATSAAVGNRRAGDAAWIAVVLAYRTWALLNPELFSLMHSRTATRLKDRNNGNSRRQATGPTTPPTRAAAQTTVPQRPETSRLR
jgi:AcrR family transcriptional regulator